MVSEHFKIHLDAEIKEDDARKHDPRVVKTETEPMREPVVRTFKAGKLKKPGEGDYSAVKAKFGALAATDMDRAARSQKDSRFHLNPLVKDPLSVQQEEQRVIEEMLQARMLALDLEVRERAQREGYEAGRKQGHTEATEEFQAACIPRVESLDQFLRGCESAKMDIFKANERLLMELVFRIARLLFLKELKADRDYVLRLASELIERVGLKEGVRISISPEEGATLEDFKAKLQTQISGLTNVTVEVSDHVKGGGCIVETKLNAIDASVETQLEGMYQSIFGAAG